MKIPYNYLARQFDAAETDAILAKLREVVATSDFTIGRPVLEFERRFGALLGCRHVVGTNSGTDALILALRAVGVGPGDEVITQANAFYASAGAIVAVGARPVFVDVDDQYAIDHRLIEAAITPRTKALLPLWHMGAPPDLSAIADIARRRGLRLVEDACPAVGAAFDGRPPGVLGDAAAFSLHPLKSLNVWGDGGAVATNDDALGAWLRLYRNHGMISRDEIIAWGVNQRLQTVQAVVANHFLDRVEAWVTRRNDIARRLDEALADVPEIAVPPRPENRRSAVTAYMVRARHRDDLIRYLGECGIEAKVHYPIPLHHQRPARNLGYKEGDCPVAEAQARELVTFPLHQYLADDEVAYMIERIRNFYRR